MPRHPETQPWEFAVGTALGLVKAVVEDEDVFVLALSAVAPRKLSRALVAWVCFRRLDSVLNVVSHFAGRAVVQLENPPVTGVPTWTPGNT